ncbi:diguanylate cyclase [Motiliproteus sp. MSK22-1]|uniref:diguanylate cyclase n=1 Tax=Motiliproteus sp. MSK22-1 TaxID=1897630 RepID=UPI000977C04C|nr:diguanylate cyclase [Motiliproteus sp. MSK22-1]OMH30389.1 hypothetical protein BGP75_18605 [Motiliproteus sp. MSK22-1]
MKAELDLLLAWSHEGEQYYFPLKEREVIIGRQEQADLVLNMPSVSRVHATIAARNDAYYIEDLESSNGTKLNGARIKPYESHALSLGDEIEIGDAKLLFQPIADYQREQNNSSKRLLPGGGSKDELELELDKLRTNIFQHVSQVSTSTLGAHLGTLLDGDLEKFRAYVEPKLHEYAVLQEITQIIIGILDVEELLSTALGLVSEALNADRGYILLFDSQEASLQPIVSQHFDRKDNSACEHDFAFSQTVATSCFEKKEIIVLEDALMDVSFSSSSSIIATSIRSVICIPLQRGSEIVGVIYLDNLSTPGIFHHHHFDFLNAFSAQTAMALENARLYSLAVTDSMTGLHNREYINERIFEEMLRTERYNSDCSLIMIDIDHFKRINDTYGHGAGDLVIKRVADQLTEMARANDVVARYGGEEFLMLLTETGRVGASVFAERLRKSIEENQMLLGDETVQITVSSGVVCYQENYHRKLTDFVADADKALYRAKNSGRNRVCVSGGG